MTDPFDDIVDQLDSLTTADPPSASAAASENTTSPTQPDANADTPVAATTKKKKKKTNRKKGKTLPTGFETNFTEAPLTPEEFSKDKELYDLNKGVAERLETAVQRYKAKRKFNDIRHRMLEAYLNLGGINTGAKMFGGVDGKFVKDHDAEDIARYKATDYVPEKMHRIGEPRLEELDEDYEEEEYTVDFNYVVRSFLTHRVPFAFGMKTPENIEMSVNLVRNFLNFILYHNVCPEYTDNIKLAVKTCDTAGEELPVCAVLSDKLPGAFNKACSTLFGGYWSLITPQSWASGEEKSTNYPEPGISVEEATQIYGSLIHEIPNIDTAMPLKDAKEVAKEWATLEVAGKWLPEPGSALKLGKIICKPWTQPEARVIPSRWDNVPEGVSLWCEKTVAQYAYVGMHLCCTVHELANGLVYFDEISGVMCSQFLEIIDEKDLEVDSDFDFD
ncbi:hypothetical protein Dda_5889 [Drechslerella dactyloides]|uniref:Argonaute-binding protein n=1 Tax=Drechslerella dactyloides TaxID=74499 RepID=A0AAD6IW14_DREDA|nr:hypothetical protein Dda_5889 [Drechslerella dactyloides]